MCVSVCAHMYAFIYSYNHFNILYRIWRWNNDHSSHGTFDLFEHIALFWVRACVCRCQRSLRPGHRRHHIRNDRSLDHFHAIFRPVQANTSFIYKLHKRKYVFSNRDEKDLKKEQHGIEFSLCRSTNHWWRDICWAASVILSSAGPRFCRITNIWINRWFVAHSFSLISLLCLFRAGSHTHTILFVDCVQRDTIYLLLSK